MAAELKADFPTAEIWEANLIIIHNIMKRALPPEDLKVLDETDAFVNKRKQTEVEKLLMKRRKVIQNKYYRWTSTLKRKMKYPRSSVESKNPPTPSKVDPKDDSAQDEFLKECQNCVTESLISVLRQYPNINYKRLQFRCEFIVSPEADVNVHEELKNLNELGEESVTIEDVNDDEEEYEVEEEEEAQT